MFYLCSIGSNLDPHIHVSRALAELLAHVGPLRLSSVIRTKPVGMHSSHDFLNCLLVVESPLDAVHLKQRFVALEVAHGRDRSDPLCKVHDRPLDIDILASNTHGNFATAEVDSYLAELLAELYGHGEVHDPKVALQVTLPGHSDKLKPGKGVLTRQVGLGPLVLGSPSEGGQRAPAIHLDAGPRHITVPHQ
ncbi:2-amino-4-hydroxy-6-hydroxymethyldihydropteridine diphosphokinase [Aeromonas allosaccharophila]|uniref:2-amino-4-hydroxy-6- hydroxymethyldihydropteridine diphosphokinase n=1 Tax=Aeromonas allosaccharophila TaxID=656 RepID=UPI001BCACA30|nr:2-amino-4-hydroxy-6-hydroxymethyldihydropteridine diphosphokinase [Aeromonas allosaccharophila]MBS4695569.1 2-amino-4-hydroxy-6-hydroxymethyldihydropteridine diphosphokinase [Aeromonas allosaccharophila]